MNNYDDNRWIDEMEKMETLKDIEEIDQLLFLYSQSGCLDQDHRDKAIQKIMDARRKELAVQVTLMPKSPATAIPYQQVSTQQLCEELNYIRNYLAGKLVGKTAKDWTEGKA